MNECACGVDGCGGVQDLERHRDEAATDAIVWDRSDPCGQEDGAGYACTRIVNHSGDHVAGTGCSIVARWPNGQPPADLSPLERTEHGRETQAHADGPRTEWTEAWAAQGAS